MSDFLEELVGGSNSRKKNERKEKACADFGFFCQTYLSDYFFTDAATYQKILYDVANTQSLSNNTITQLKPFVKEDYHSLLVPTEKLAGAMFIEPREHGKTVRWSFAYALWCVLTGKRRYILLIGASADSARENLSNIKIELEENDDIIEDFGDLKGKVWRDNRLELTNGTCIQSKGAGASMRGTRFHQYRPDLIILDDVLKDDAVDSVSQRNKTSRWLKRVVFNLGKESFIIWVNTVFHGDDPISRLCDEVRGGSLKRWIAVRLSCLCPDGSALWPEYWSVEELEEKRAQLGFSIFSTEYMNEPLSDEERIINPDWIKAHQYEAWEIPPFGDLGYYMGIDPATGVHDRTAFVPVAAHKKTGIIYVLTPSAKKCSETETVKQSIFLHRVYRFIAIGWENVVFSGIYGKFVQKEAAREKVYLPIKLLTVGRMSKEARLRSISTLIETGIIWLPKKGAENLIDELTEFPKGAFDDLCDALWLAVQAIEKGDKKAVVSNNFTLKSAAKSVINKVRGFQ